jgi:hypothetical protein
MKIGLYVGGSVMLITENYLGAAADQSREQAVIEPRQENGLRD